VLTLLHRFPKGGGCASGEGWNFLGKLYNKIKLVVIMELSEIDCLISCIPTRNATLAATRILGSIKSFFRFLRLLHCHLSSEFRVALSTRCIATIGIPCHSVHICNPSIALRPVTALWHTNQFLVICYKYAKYDKVWVHI
jgi:hypothetical protein